MDLEAGKTKLVFIRSPQLPNRILVEMFTTRRNSRRYAPIDLPPTPFVTFVGNEITLGQFDAKYYIEPGIYSVSAPVSVDAYEGLVERSMTVTSLTAFGAGVSVEFNSGDWRAANRLLKTCVQKAVERRTLS